MKKNILKELVFDKEFIHGKDIASMTFQALTFESKTSFEKSTLLLKSSSYALFAMYSSVWWTLRSWDYNVSLKIKELK